LNVTGDDSHSGGDLTYGENLTLNYSVASNGHFTIPAGAGTDGQTGYVVSPFETDFLDAGSPAQMSKHPTVILAQSIPAPPGTPSPTAMTVNFAAPVAIGSMAQSAAITITNTGLGPMAFPSVDTTNSPDFTATSTCIPVSFLPIFQPGGTCTITFTFAPTAGTPTGTMLNETLILLTDGTSNVTFTLTGTALASGACGTNTWVGPATGAWATAGNWSGGAPVSTDDVCIPTGFTVTVGALALANQ